MDGLIATILAGVIVTVIGTILAFYFGGVRERQKREYERQQEEQRQETERQEALNERRAKALDELRVQCQSFVEAYKDWTARAMNLEQMALPTENLLGSLNDPNQRSGDVDKTKIEIRALGQQAQGISEGMKVLEGMYQAQKPYLEAKTRRIFESFHKEFSERHGLLSNKLEYLNAIWGVNTTKKS